VNEPPAWLVVHVTPAPGAVPVAVAPHREVLGATTADRLVTTFRMVIVSVPGNVPARGSS